MIQWARTLLKVSVGATLKPLPSTNTQSSLLVDVIVSLFNIDSHPNVARVLHGSSSYCVTTCVVRITTSLNLFQSMLGGNSNSGSFSKNLVDVQKNVTVLKSARKGEEI